MVKENMEQMKKIAKMMGVNDFELSGDLAQQMVKDSKGGDDKTLVQKMQDDSEYKPTQHSEFNDEALGFDRK